MTFDINNIDSMHYTVKVLKELIPEAQLNIRFPQGTFDYSGIELLNGDLPDKEYLLKKIQELYEEDMIRLNQTEYQRQRAPEYPSIGDQLDAIWKGGDAYDVMLAKVMAVKDKYPKPE